MTTKDATPAQLEILRRLNDHLATLRKSIQGVTSKAELAALKLQLELAESDLALVERELLTPSRKPTA